MDFAHYQFNHAGGLVRHPLYGTGDPIGHMDSVDS